MGTGDGRCWTLAGIGDREIYRWTLVGTGGGGGSDHYWILKGTAEREAVNGIWKELGTERLSMDSGKNW